MLINLSEIMSVKGIVKHIEAPIELGSFHLDGTDYDFVKKNPVDFTISHVGERRIDLEASTKLSLSIPCSRCLEGVETSFDITVSKELDFNETDEDRIKELDETNYIDGYNLDVDQFIYDEILISFPLKVLCSEDCKGICNVCGGNLNKETCNCDQSVGDPRMSVIRDIFNNFKEV